MGRTQLSGHLRPVISVDGCLYM